MSASMTSNIIDVLEHIDKQAADLTSFITVTRDLSGDPNTNPNYGVRYNGETWNEFFGNGIDNFHKAQALLEDIGFDGEDEGTKFVLDLKEYGFGYKDVGSATGTYTVNHLNSIAKQSTQNGMASWQMVNEVNQKVNRMVG